MVDPADDMVIPGYDGLITELDYRDLSNARLQIDQSYIKCRHCQAPITTENLADPSRRAWVPLFPGRDVESFDANPLVLPQLRTCPRLLKDLTLYKNTQRWLQFALGKPAEAASDMILQSTLERCFTVGRPEGAMNTALGMDVGKTSHIAVGKRVGEVFEVFWLETSRQTGDNATGERVVELYRQYGSVQGVVDAAPDVSLPKWLQGQLPYNQVWGCYFVRGRGKSNLVAWETDETAGTVKVNRTRALDEFVEACNKGKVRLPKGLAFEAEVKQHLQRMKRVLNLDSAGEEQAQWIATDPATHWFFAVFYAWLASQMAGEATGVLPGVSLSRLIGTVRVATGQPEAWLGKNPLQVQRLSL
jgi:hypothetical protein